MKIQSSWPVTISDITLYRNQTFCVDATEETPRLGRLLNHSKKNPNVVTKVKVVDNIPRLCLYAKKFIRPGEELTFDYGDRTPFSISANPWLKF